ncbi:ThuA domain-containing protein [Jeotgalibacillus campisalis]|uniref:ThuA-like domain-containing protein n=1 Tax=Jeotgalibacillus campisalis TaxID=220754 RepID=A0A0C2V1Y4_9BACL|nr:ThuA domain-containing protein [Jeotgalibacillus campisalis]KIL43052.1 hypothetical protein KR50_34550 [Jeotgalibacillus campisalis]
MAKQMLAVLGDFYHEEDRARSSLELAINQMKEPITITFATVLDLQNELSDKWDGVILFAENRLNPQDEQVETWMNEEAAEAIASFVKKGGSWLAWHSGLSSYDSVDTYTDMLKGSFDYHPKKHQVVRYSIDERSAYSSLESFSIVDEHYFVHCTAEPEEIFMHSSSVDGDSIAGWSHAYGAGKVVCLTPAHNEEGLTDPSFTRVLAAALHQL